MHHGIFPDAEKEKTEEKTMKKFLIFIMCAVFLFGVYAAYRYYLEEVLPEKQLEENLQLQKEVFRKIKPSVILPDEIVESSPDVTEYAVETVESSDGISVETVETVENSSEPENLLEVSVSLNEDVIGWLSIPGTKIDYPVVQKENDNQFYLTRGIDGKENGLGTPFLDYRCSSDFSGFTSIIYAHNIENYEMFAEIANYREKSFLESHPSGYLILPDAVHELDFIAFALVPGDSALYHTVFVTEQEQKEYINFLKNTSEYFIDQNLIQQHLILLSTCTFENEKARGVLIGIIK